MKIPCAICKQLFAPLRGRSTCDRCMKETAEAYCKKYGLPTLNPFDTKQSGAKVEARDTGN